MDYSIPKADRFVMFETDHTETRTPLNPLGAKGIGEAATIGSTPSDGQRRHGRAGAVRRHALERADDLAEGVERDS